jgi:hypothetical protein
MWKDKALCAATTTRLAVAAKAPSRHVAVRRVTTAVLAHRIHCPRSCERLGLFVGEHSAFNIRVTFCKGVTFREGYQTRGSVVVFGLSQVGFRFHKEYLATRVHSWSNIRDAKGGYFPTEGATN